MAARLPASGGLAVPAAFAQPSNTEPTEEIYPQAPSSVGAGWQSSALFAAPPPSPPPDKAKVPVMASRLRPPASGQQGINEAPGTQEEPERSAKSTAKGQDSHHTTPVKVSERIMMFERNTTPASRPALGPVASTSRLASAKGSAKASQPGLLNSASIPPATAPGGVVDGSSLFTPQQRVVQPMSDVVQPKDLFGNASDLGSKVAVAKNPSRPVKSGLSGSASASSFKVKDIQAPVANLTPAGSQGSFMQSGMKVPDGEREKTAFADGCDRLAAGSKRDDVAKPKSLKAAEQARLQEERKQRERQEREEHRERVRASAAAATAMAGQDDSLLGTSRSQTKLTASAVAAASRSATTKKTIRGPADVNPEASAETRNTAGASALQDISGDVPAAGSTRLCNKGPKPSVPLFRDYARELRQKVLPPKNPDDNYEISDQEDSEGDDPQEQDDRRSRKHVPLWCATFLADMQSQADIDPDNIFSRVPQCNMDEIFTDEMYAQVGKSRPKRARGSSGDWKKDRLTRTEIQDYKSKMGHRRNWDEEPAAKKDNPARVASSSKR